MTEQPTLTDGTVTLRPWREDDVAEAVAGHDELHAHWFGASGPPTAEEHLAAVRGWRRDWDRGTRAGFAVTVEDRLVGSVEARRLDEHTVDASWTLYAGERGHGYAARAVRVLVDWALTERGQGGLGASRVEARVEPDNKPGHRVATRAGLRREGVRRVVAGTGDREDTSEYVVLARLADDPPLSEPAGFRALLNSFLPRKRAIGQVLVRDTSGRVLLCELTYKRDWDLPGGVVEVGESPQRAAGREVREELGLPLDAGRLLLTDWLPPWGGWDDALCLVFDGGTHDPAILDAVVREEREIQAAHWVAPDELEHHTRDFTARRVRAALANLDDTAPAYVEGGGSEAD